MRRRWKTCWRFSAARRAGPPPGGNNSMAIDLMKQLWRSLPPTVALTASLLTAQVTPEQIRKAPAADWLTYAGDYTGQRHSTLTQINRKTAPSLTPKWIYHVDGAKRLEASPLVYQGVMYVANTNEVHALDARTGRRARALRWC